MNVSVIIPVHLDSKRLPGKALADIKGKPLLWHLWSRVTQADCIRDVIVATDSRKIRSAVEEWGGKVLMTRPDCQCGTERIIDCLNRLEGAYFINVQADMPLLDPEVLNEIVRNWRVGMWDIVTPVYRITKMEELFNPNIVKVVCSKDGRALYFSRSCIPYVRDIPKEQWLDQCTFWGHIGIYAYKRKVLEAYKDLSETELEAREKLEQLRFLDAGYHIQTIETRCPPLTVDAPEDLEKVRGIVD